MIGKLAHQILSAIVVLGAIAAADAADLIQWSPNLDQARIAAKQQNKLLLIHFWSPTCAPCKIADKHVFPNPAVARAINENFIPLKINAVEHADLRTHFGIEQVPTDVVSTIDGRALHQMVTDTNPTKYLDKLNTLAKQFAPRFEDATMVAQGATTPAQQPQDTQPKKWSNYDAPEMAKSQAMARRPGTDPAMRPGAGLSATADRSAKVPGVAAPNGTGSPSYSRFDRPGTDSAVPSVAAHQSAFSNQFAQHNSQETANQHRTTTTPTQPNRGAEIANPYVQQAQPGAQPATLNRREVAGFAADQSGTSRRTAAAPRSQLDQPRGPSGNGQQTQPNLNSRVDTAPPQQAPIGLDRRCPVTLISQGKWRKGDERWGAIHRGKTYLFAGPNEQQTFLASPDDYSPVLAGMDVVRLADQGAVVQGTRRFGVLFDDDGAGPKQSRIYLFDSVETRNRFEATPDEFLNPVMQAMRQGTLDSLIR